MHAVLIQRGEKFNPNFFYKTGFDIDHCFYCEIKKEKILFSNEMNLNLASTLSKRKGIKTIDLKNMVELLKKKKVNSLKMDLENCSAKLYQKLSSKFKINDFSDELKMQRAIKSIDEIAKIKKACKKTMELIHEIEIKPEMKEKQIASMLISKTYEMNLEFAFEPIVANAKNARFPHYKPGNDKIGNIFLIDYGVKYNRYCSDISEMIFLKKDLKLGEIYESLKGIFYDICDNTENFNNAGELAKFAWKLYEKEKITKPPHAIGHGIGLEVHEFPWLNEKSKMKLENTTIAIEPALYTKNFGLRFERTLFIDKKRKAFVL